MADGADDDLRTLIREFRTSVSARLGQHDQRLDGLETRMGGLDDRVGELAVEFRDRTRTMEMAILNAIRDLSRDIDRRLTRLEG